MTPTEAAALLAVAAAFDNRKPDADAAQAWAIALDGHPFADCREAIVAHYRGSREWLMPTDIIAGVRKVRNKRIEEFERVYLVDPPTEYADDPNAEMAWRREVKRRIGDGEVTHPEQIEPNGGTYERRGLIEDRERAAEIAARVGVVGRATDPPESFREARKAMRRPDDDEPIEGEHA